MLKNYIKIAFRHINANKTFSFINVFGLMLGFYCVTLIFSWINYEISYDKFHENVDAIHRVAFTNAKADYFGIYQPGLLANHLKDIIPEITHSTSYSEMQWSISHQNKSYSVSGSYVESDFFTMFSFPFILGSEKTFSEEPNSIIITRKLANKIFGNDDPIAKRIEFNNRSYKVIGILQDIPQNSSMQFDALIPFEHSPQFMKEWNLKSTTTFVMLASPKLVEIVNEKISDVMNQHNPEWNNILYLNPISETHLYNLEGGGTIIYIFIFAFLGITVLTIACINFVNLTIAYSHRRIREIGMRKTIGASKFSIQLQFLSESVIFAVISMTIAIFFINFSLPHLNLILGRSIPIDYSFVDLVTITLFAITIGILAGAYPAIAFSRIKAIKMLGNSMNSGTGGKSSKLRHVLVTTQFTLSIIFIILLFGINDQISFIKNKELGYSKDHLVMISTRGELKKKVPEIKKKLLEESNIKNVTVSGNDIISLNGTGSGPLDWPNRVNERIVEAGVNVVDYDFLTTMGMKISEGRFFSEEFKTDETEAVVVNEEAVRQMELKDPIGKVISFNQGSFKKSGTIVGIVKDFHDGSLHNLISPIIMWPTPTANLLIVKINSDNPEAALNTIETVIDKFATLSQFHYEFFDKKIEHQYQIENLTSNLILYISVLMLIISCLGLFGLTSIISRQRSKEISIRKVLGASVPRILKLLGKEYVYLLIVANIISFPIAYIALDNWLSNFSYRVEINMYFFLMAGTLSILVAFLTLCYQAIKAATANPVDSLRNE